MGFFCQPDLSETTRSGRRFARTKEGDELVDHRPRPRATRSPPSAATARCSRFAAEELPELAGAGRGVILMRARPRRDAGRAPSAIRSDRPPIAIADDGSERRFTLPEGGHRAQKGRKALKRFKVVELAPVRSAVSAAATRAAAPQRREVPVPVAHAARVMLRAAALRRPRRQLSPAEPPEPLDDGGLPMLTTPH